MSKKKKSFLILSNVLALSLGSFNLISCTKEQPKPPTEPSDPVASAVSNYQQTHAEILQKNSNNILLDDEAKVVAALNQYNSLEQNIKNNLTSQKTLLDQLNAKIKELKETQNKANPSPSTGSKDPVDPNKPQEPKNNNPIDQDSDKKSQLSLKQDQIKVIKQSAASLPTNVISIFDTILNNERYTQEINLENFTEFVNSLLTINNSVSVYQAKNYNNEYKTFLEKVLNKDYNLLLSSYQNSISLISSNEQELLTNLTNETTKLKELEISFVSFSQNGEKILDDFNSLVNIFTQENTIFNEDVKTSVLYNEAINDYKINNNLLNTINKYSSINTKALSLKTIYKTLVDKSNKDQQTRDFINNVSQYYNGEFLNSDKLSEINLLTTLDNFIVQANEISKNSQNQENLNNLRTQAKTYINNLNNLSNELKNAFIAHVDTLNIESLINETKNTANLYHQKVSDILAAINQANQVKTTSKYNNASNKTDFERYLSETTNLLQNNLLVNKAEYVNSASNISSINNLLNNLAEAQDNLNGNVSSEETRRFKESVESKLSATLSENLTRYNLASEVYSVNITENNKKLFLANPKVEGATLTLKGIKTVENNINQLIFVYTAKSNTESTLVTDVEKTYTFTNDFNTKLNLLTYSNLDEIFTVNYENLKNYYQSDLKANEAKIKESFSSKNNILHNYFKFRFKTGSFSYENSKLAADLEFLVNERVVKTIKLTTQNNVTFKEEWLKGVSITPSEWFKQQAFYKEPGSWKPAQTAPDLLQKYQFFGSQKSSNILTWFGLNVFNVEKDKIEALKNKELKAKVNLVNPPAASDNNQNVLTPEEIKQVHQKIKETFISQIFTITLPTNVTYELINYSDSDIFYVSDSNKDVAIFKFKVKQGDKEQIIEVELADEKNDKSTNQDYKDFNYLLNLIKTDTKDDVSKIFELTTVKDPKKTHNQVNSKDAVKALNEYYELPKAGKFQLYAYELTDSKNYVDSNVGGTAKVKFWIKENGQPVDVTRNRFLVNYQSLGQYSKTIKYFKPLTYLDIKPNNTNSWFSASDFSSDNIDQNHKNIIDQINSTNFELRKANATKETQYAIIDPKDIIAQNAANKLNYMLKLKTNSVSEDNSKNNEFKNPEKKQAADDKKIENANKQASYWASSATIANTTDQTNSIDLSQIQKNYFVYYYDVVSNDPNELSFKLGFISKSDTTKRYTNSSKVITLKNLRNDYKENLYPEIMVNSLTYDDLLIQNISSLTVQEFINKDKNTLKSYASVKNDQTYKNFTISKDKFEITETKQGANNSVYVKFKVTNPTTNLSYIANTWYKITGFRAGNTAQEQLTFKETQLQTVFDSNTSVTRTREIEAYYEDLLWTLDSQTNSASWTLAEKYISKTLLANNATQRKLKVSLFANQLIQDDKRLLRISDEKERQAPFEFDFEQLASGQTISHRVQTRLYSNLNGGNYPQFYYNFSAKYEAGKGIIFKVTLEDNQYKIIVGNPYKEAITFSETTDERKFGKFDKDKAFLINTAGAAVTIQYTNSVQKESFTTTETNQFNYQKLDYTQENQPILFFTPEEIIKSNEYNPNQNVSWKLHDGYKLDQEYMHSSWEGIELVDNVRARSFAYNRGSATMIGKVSKDPSDGKFYVITNNHVEHISNFSEVEGNNLPKTKESSYLTKYSNNFVNNVDDGFSYWGGLNVANKVPVEVIWSGVDQINEKGAKATGMQVDLTVFAVDIKPLIATAKKEGKFDLVVWLENWYKLPNMDMNYLGSEDGVQFGPNLKQFAINGFPYGKQAGYFVNRAQSSSSVISLFRQNGYVQSYFNSGNSGTGILGPNNSYISTINSGVPLTELVAWNYETSAYNYLGVNKSGEDALSIKNTNSVAAQILRWHLKKPAEVDLPWFLQEIKTK